MQKQKKILAQFQMLGFMQDSQLTQYQFNKSLDKLLQKNASIYGFDRNVSQQIWNKTYKEQNETAWLMNLIDTILDAQQIVRENLKRQQEQVQDTATQDLLSYLHDDKHLSLAFGFQAYNSQKLQNVRYPENDDKSNSRQNSKNIIISSRQTELANLQSSPKLKNVMLITIFMFALQLFVMCHKHHFYNGLIQLAILMLVIGNFFGQTYNKFLIKLIALGIVLDLVWLIVQAKNYWSPSGQTIHSKINGPFLKLVYLLVVILIVPKVMIIVMMAQFWDVQREYRKKVQLKLFKFQQNWIVDGKEEFNIVASLLKGNHSNSQNFQQ